MKAAPWHHVDQFREGGDHPYASPWGAPYGFFMIPGPCAQVLKVIVSDGHLDPKYPWDHVSVSCKNRCPNWQEMEFIKHLFFKEDEWAMQLHAPPTKHINCHPFVLHIWRPLNAEIPLPDPIMVGPPGQ